jgi:hypothetical protein
MVAGRFVWDARRRAKTFYGVTDRHILIVYGVASKKTTMLALKSLPGLTLDERYNGDGDVVLDTLSVILLRIYHQAHKQEGCSALISDHHQERMIGDESESFWGPEWPAN